MTLRIHSAAVIGIEAIPVTVEADIVSALPHFSIVGLPDKSVQEARERVQIAMKNSGLPFPRTKVVVNLAPGDSKKEGSGYDLPIAAAIMAAQGLLADDGVKRLLLGELAFDGTLRPIPGILPVAVMAARLDYGELVVPAANADEAALADNIAVIPVSTLAEAALHLRGEQRIAPHPVPALPCVDARADVDFAHIRGQTRAKRALEIAAAGGHNVLFTGPPGAGKSLLAKAMATILPPMNKEEMIEVTAIHSIAGLTTATGRLVAQRPFRSPHHTTSGIALIGGGTWVKPGEVSLAHRGVLFLDELPEFPRTALENLRQPLEDGFVTIARANGTVRFPTSFMFVAARNPCPCGYATDATNRCVCAPPQITKYAAKISGPLLDRIDIHVDVARVPIDDLFAPSLAESSAAVRARVAAGREVQRARFAGTPTRTNAEMRREHVEIFCGLDDPARELLMRAARKLLMSARAVMRVRKVARTIADLATAPGIAKEHVAEAIQYRGYE